MKIQYRNVNLRDGAREMITLCNGIIGEYRRQGLVLTLRQLYYQFVSRDAFPEDRKWTEVSKGKWIRDSNGTPNADPNYKWLGSILSDGRLAGLIDWEAIEDRGRPPRSVSEWKNVSEIMESVFNSYRLPRWRGQDSYVELWVEKEALAGVLTPLAREFHVTLMVNKGYSSQSAMYESAQRFIEKCRRNDSEEDREADVVAEAWENGNEETGGDPVDLVRRPVLLYLGDHDPSGEDMVRDIRDRLAMFGVGVDVSKIALTMDQIRRYNPPPNPAKVTDPRARAYIEKFGRSSWEVDALPPNVLAQIIRSAFRAVVDQERMDEVKAKEETDKAKLREAVSEIMNGEEE